MKKKAPKKPLKSILVFIFSSISCLLFSQNQAGTFNNSSDFWEKVQFGGGIGLNLGSGFTEIALAPSAIYNFNNYFAFGLGTQYSYVKQRNFYTSHLYGGSLIGLFNPMEEIQLSAEIEQLRVNVNLDGSNTNSQNYWNTGLFIGAGYRTGNVTIGGRYNVLFNQNDNVYSNAFMPFVRIYF